MFALTGLLLACHGQRDGQPNDLLPDEHPVQGLLPDGPSQLLPDLHRSGQATNYRVHWPLGAIFPTRNAALPSIQPEELY